MSWSELLRRRPDVAIDPDGYLTRRTSSHLSNGLYENKRSSSQVRL